MNWETVRELSAETMTDAKRLAGRLGDALCPEDEKGEVLVRVPVDEALALRKVFNAMREDLRAECIRKIGLLDVETTGGRREHHEICERLRGIEARQDEWAFNDIWSLCDELGVP